MLTGTLSSEKTLFSNFPTLFISISPRIDYFGNDLRSTICLISKTYVAERLAITHDPVVSALIAKTQTKQRTNMPEAFWEGGSLHRAVFHNWRCLLYYYWLQSEYTAVFRLASHSDPSLVGAVRLSPHCLGSPTILDLSWREVWGECSQIMAIMLVHCVYNNPLVLSKQNAMTEQSVPGRPKLYVLANRFQSLRKRRSALSGRTCLPWKCLLGLGF